MAKLNKEAVATLQSALAKQRFGDEGADVVASFPDQFGSFIKRETDKWAKVAKAARIQPE